MLYALQGSRVFSRKDVIPLGSFAPPEWATLSTMLTKGINCPRTTSMGRLFDGLSSIIGLCQQAGFEGQGAMDLEFSLAGIERVDPISPRRLFMVSFCI